jgi:hypothetical protein
MYDLNERELNRLLHSAQQRGMKVCWSLHRANRLASIHAIMPLTCRTLGANLRREVDAFWSGALPEDLQFKSEAKRFASFLRNRMREGWLDIPVLDDLVSLELAMAELRFTPQGVIRERLARSETLPDAAIILHPLIRLLLFRNDPEPLLEALTSERAVPADLARGDYHVLLDVRGEAIVIRVLDARLATILNAFKVGDPPMLDGAEIDVLLKDGLVARWHTQ